MSHVKDGWIYFTADNLAQSSEFECKGFNVNYDYIYAGINPRFRLWNISIDDSKQVGVVGGKVSTDQGIIHECRATNFISLYHNRYRSFVVSGLRFVGNAKGSSLIGLSDVNTDWLIISDCCFEDINSVIVFAFKTKNFVFSNNNKRINAEAVF